VNPPGRPKGGHPSARRDGRPVQLRVGGLTRLSATDYPGELAAVVFCQGCPWRCGYCHNPHLLDGKADVPLAWNDVSDFLATRVGLLDAVVFSGGEPLAQRALDDALRAVRDLGFRVGLHTGGAYPVRLAAVLPLVDWVGFDVKADFGGYDPITRTPNSGERALASARLLLHSGVPHEFRTTVHPGHHRADALAALAERLAAMGVTRYALQEFRAGGCVDPEWARPQVPSFLTREYCARIGARFTELVVRRA